jgi:hypothetical protein
MGQTCVGNWNDKSKSKGDARDLSFALTPAVYSLHSRILYSILTV